MLTARLCPITALAVVLTLVVLLIASGNAPFSARTSTAAVCPASIGFGETITCSIEGASEVDVYSFSATSGDKVQVREIRTSGSVWPGVQVYDDATKICEKTGSTGQEVICDLTGTGPYSVHVSDGFNGTLTGDYNLFLQRLNSPVGAHPIASGEVKTASIDPAPEVDIYTLPGSTGETIDLYARRSSGSVWPKIRVWSGTTKICEDSDPWVIQLTCELTSGGPYNAQFLDGFNGTLAGGYCLSLDNPAPLTDCPPIETPPAPSATPTPTPTPTATPVGQPPTPTPTATPVGQTPTPTPTATPVGQSPTPTPTATPVGQTPSATPTRAADHVFWGDHNCSGSANPIDSLLTLRFDAGLSANTGSCPEMGVVVDIAFASLHVWGDVDCGGEVTPVDSLKLLRFDARLSVTQPAGCPEIGQQVQITPQ